MRTTRLCAALLVPMVALFAPSARAQAPDKPHTLRSKLSFVYATAVSGDGKLLVVGGKEGLEGIVEIWELPEKKERFTVRHGVQVQHVAIAPGGKTVASAAWEIVDKKTVATLKLWDAATGKDLDTLKGHARVATQVRFSPDGKWLASSDLAGNVKIWDVSTRKERHSVQGVQDVAISLAFSPDSKKLAVGGGKPQGPGKLKIWIVETGKEEVELDDKDMRFQVSAVHFSPDGKTLVAGEGFRVWFWDVANKKKLGNSGDALGRVISLALSADGKVLFAGTSDGWIAVLDGATGKKHAELLFGLPSCHSIHLLSGSKSLIGSGGVSVLQWDVEESIKGKGKK